MSFEVDHNRQNQGTDLWNFHDGSSADACLVKETEQSDPRAAASGKTAAVRGRRTDRQGRRTDGQGRKTGASGTGASRAAGGGFALKLFLIVFMAALCIVAAGFIAAYQRMQSRTQEKTESRETVFYGDADTDSILSALLPLPKGVTYDHLEILSADSPYEIAICTKGLDRVPSASLGTCAMFAFEILDDLDVLHFTDVSSDVAYTFHRNEGSPFPVLQKEDM